MNKIGKCLLKYVSAVTFILVFNCLGLSVNAQSSQKKFDYTIKNGDTLWGIASKFNSTVNAISKKNFIKKPDRIYAGDVLAIPITYRFPGEFEKQQAIWMQWPTESYEANSHPVSHVMVSIIKALNPYIRINLIVRSEDEIIQVKNMLNETKYSRSNVHYYIIDHLSIWARDVGPLSVKDNRNRLNVVDFGFNNYNKDDDQDFTNTESQIDKLAAQALNLPVINSTLISEGGAIESNGKGTMMVSESVALARNPGLTKQQIEDEYKRVLGVKKIIWLKKGLSEDDGITGGHTDEFARFANPNTILLAKILPSERYVNPALKESYLRLEENYNILKNSTDQDGNPFRIIRVPMPPTLYNDMDYTGTLTVRSYLNYVVTNGAVLIQTYWHPGSSNMLKSTENGVKEIFKDVFPGRSLIDIDAENVNLWGGGIHCITQHMPAN